MCGRYTLTNLGQVSIRFAVAEPNDDLDVGPRYNIAPTQGVPVILAPTGERALASMRWGYQHARLAGTAGAPAPINARAETLLEKPLFRGSLTRRRCLIPADGFYEWQATAGRKSKQPYYISLADHQLFAFAGIYTERIGPDGEQESSCAIITTTPNTLMEEIHTRMPAILAPEDEALWLDPAVAADTAVMACLRPYPAALMTAFPVSTRVSSARNEGPDLIEPLAEE
jgi:putative SOS response-associated peptidase YedK